MLCFHNRFMWSGEKLTKDNESEKERGLCGWSWLGCSSCCQLHTFLSSTAILCFFLIHPSPLCLRSSRQISVLHLPIESIPLYVSHHHHFCNPCIYSYSPSSPFTFKKLFHADLKLPPTLVFLSNLSFLLFFTFFFSLPSPLFHQ